ncbi:hypothetical protein KNP414_05207 [Paenibacillus mucilaginosus KNP414]|uniref:Uncharacterized protein n=1 Tax=Paenibacillus mucilaginosus (strain KNP414) TaxID=1036673 RepID=F8FBX0_PAEMK|nr:hypothetical protein KNP414_05207 [Paenibacillus mucilaginosus KNP414]
MTVTFVRSTTERKTIYPSVPIKFIDLNGNSDIIKSTDKEQRIYSCEGDK